MASHKIEKEKKSQKFHITVGITCFTHQERCYQSRSADTKMLH
uniref:Uncharacterized protein n=1 Tax=Rhizophora mucronata TaxID=61149 RepID=A0A2P2PM27_RHIMU